ncbi:MAG TPA: TIR domain-containing protein [Pyrinomonadaceae bacterium]|nr:TIR domain-containing protein [Pyrinomonadaceae bacterium]
MERLFLSHSHGDHELATALKSLIESCFPGHIEVKASSSAPAEGGIPAGSDWLDWILEQVRNSKFTAVILTPNSIDKPWLMWEAGAVSGVSLGAEKISTVIPVVYRLSMEQVPSPLRSRQAARGEDSEAMKRVLQSLKATVSLPESALHQLAEVFIPPYLAKVAQALAETPPPLTESAVQEWLDRITYFEKTDRRSEVKQLHRAMVNVFAPGDNGFETPLDVRFHRRLGDIYLFSKQSAEAVKQYDLALRLSPRDIFLMHKKGLALLETGNEPGAEEMLKAIAKIDPAATQWSTEIAGMKGRLYWQKYQQSGLRSDLEAARDAYADGFDANNDSSYMADNVGQLSLLLGEPERAKEAFRKGLQALEKTGDRGYWAMATKASCHFGISEDAEGIHALQQICDLGPEPAALDSIRRGLIRLHKGLNGKQDQLDQWLFILAGMS